MCPVLGVFKNYVIFLSANQHKQIMYYDLRPGLGWRRACDRWPGGGPQPCRCLRPVGRPRLGRCTARPFVSTLYALFFNHAPGLVAAPGIRKVCSCAWCWRFERFLTQGDLVMILHFSFFSLHHWCKALRQKGRRWHPYRHIFQNLGSWLGFNRTKVSISTKNRRSRTSSGTLSSPMTSSFLGKRTP